MNYGELKTALRSLINRKDITDDLAAQFVSMAQARLQRNLRPSFLQRLASFNIDPDAEIVGSFALPEDFLELISLYTDTGGEVERVGPKAFLAADSGTGLPQVYTQAGHNYLLRPVPEATETIWIHYYGAESDLSAESDTNLWTLSCPDALLYGAAIFAAHHFEDERLPQFTDQYAIFVSEIEDQIYREDYSGPARISPASTYDDGMY